MTMIQHQIDHPELYEPCERCKGSGEISGTRLIGEEGMYLEQDWEGECPDCKGTGLALIDPDE